MDTVNCSDDIPHSWEYFQGLDVGGIALISICGFLTMITVILYLVEIMYIRNNIMDWTRRQKTILLLGLYPVFSFTSMMGICVPRASTLATLASTIYLSICIFAFLHLMINYYGDNESMIQQLSQYSIPLRSPPCCCCCFCLPNIKLTIKNLRIIKRLVHQIIIVSPMVAFLSAVFWADGLYTRNFGNPMSAYTYLTAIKVVSTLTAMYGLLLLFRVSRLPLKHYSIQPKFILLQLVLVAANLQNTVTTLLATVKVIPCTSLMPSSSRAQFLDHVLITFEMFLLSLVARFIYRKKLQKLEDNLKQTDEEEEDDEVARKHVPHRLSTVGLVKEREGYGTTDTTIVRKNGGGGEKVEFDNAVINDFGNLSVEPGSAYI
ncbi:organic solute transporter subunit alpha isoform X1 [Lingula anatina]|uniref:Organic solute transporter subunit alpha isoform X1 n=1 Tax=Lingula anatina TaxID=7574 RepID=A0A1S3IBD0_LINAN|nr:organic solute transporter subunit alpha isoform X1 [Lingula anatina]XP_013395567.1 organic solute transporter subunit alpha isoform X1 [Lingula anatina]XP_013395568.1 organic solute transporter subunit alpha isoform X1 [Lingula anatina]XP_013395569.1 organic solute transporter subunit alpha isoform X1 [Lingula anatina]|eukprot:XP_013395566.1 organic solute transporter subunit alpha isoform X1 [Lingula anatina]